MAGCRRQRSGATPLTLKRLIPRFGALDRGPGQARAATWTGLAIDLGGSVEIGCRLADRGVAYLGELLRWVRRETKGMCP